MATNNLATLPTNTQTLAPASVNMPSVTNNAMPDGSITGASISAPTTASTNGATATGYDAATRSINPATDTVQGQFNGLIHDNSPLIQTARTNALQGMNARGLLNSSMAQQASDQAAYSAALPIANADANIYNQAGAQNQQAENASSSQNAQTATQTSQFNADAQNKASMFNTDEALKAGLATLDSQTKTNLADIEANYKNLMQANASASSLYSQVVQNLTNISNSTTMDQAAKNQATANQMSMLQSGMGVIGAISNLNLSSLLNFNTSASTV